MTHEQEAIWLSDAFAESRSRYTVLWTHRIHGPLDTGALALAIDRLTSAHPGLRTRYGLHEGQPAQIVEDTGAALESEDCPPEAVERRLRELAELDLDLDQAPMRAFLLRLGREDHVLALLLHHIAMDGWSLQVMADDIARWYADPTLPPVPALTMGEYARRQRAQEADAAAVAYWRDRLQSPPQFTTVPADWRRPAEIGHAGDRVEFVLDGATAQAVRAVARAGRTTAFTVLTAAYAALLHRHGGQQDLVVGTPVARRGAAELDRVVGCLADLLPLRLTVTPEMSFADLVAAVKQESLAAQRHCGVPLTTIVRQTVTAGEPDRFPLFQAVIGIDDGESTQLRLPGLRVEPLEVHTGTSKFDLLLRLSGSDGPVLGMLDYSTELYHPATARRLVDRFRTLLASALSEPGRSIGDLDLLAPDEFDLVTRVFAQAPAPTTRPALAHEAFEAQRQRTPDAIAAIWRDRQVTYAEVGAAADRLAQVLHRQRDGGPVRPIGILLERSVDMVVAVLAVLKSGAAYVPLDPTYPGERLAYMLGDSDVACLLAQPWLVDAVPMPDGVTVLEPDRWYDLPDGAGSALPVATEADLAYLIYTSGSTGLPKGVAMPHGPLAGLVAWQCGDSACGPGDRTLQYSALSFDASFLEIFSTWSTGGTLVLVDAEERADYDLLLAVIGKHAVRRMFLPFAALQSIAQYVTALGLEPPPLREFVCAGEQIHVTPAIRQFFAALDDATLFNQYGPSETHSVTSLRIDGDPATWPLLPAIGYPINSARVTILDDRLRPQPVGVAGELCVSGLPLADGYWRKPELTRERFVDSPLPGIGRLYRTGDVARFLHDGRIEFLGRRDGMVKIRGYRVELGEVEAVVRQAPGVVGAVVTAETLGVGDTRLTAFYRTASGEQLDLDTLRRAITARVPDYMLPSRFVHLPAEFPRTPSGKVDRLALVREHGGRPASPSHR
ncbi:amino acid adenylation domain-containing protein [Micromonospora sp. M71_S20]|uniref:non-ribosomal peptide synthetase n=1 Tax=Micromonospora sp. M71_S20 TaxID=592872 RepID=UPI000EACF2AF|nr:amino acid adenylation domain-containing protein [Micromonospora sp. M71_S20]RLK09774.1 amino acid adenylation domain-containing protein [Micromonospora sp. M71_S20]